LRPMQIELKFQCVCRLGFLGGVYIMSILNS
jgi:hypothetical protein